MAFIKETLNIIFPMAGDGMRFGGVFKPFYYVGESYFIELAKYRFDIFNEFYDVKYHLIYRKDQEDKYSITSKFKMLFPNDTLNFCIISDKTSGPLQTVIRALSLYKITGPSFVCDCDLSINLELFLNLLRSPFKYDYIVSAYQIPKSHWFEWGKIILNSTDTIVGFCEKEDPTTPGTVLGLIGCHYINDINMIRKYEELSSFSSCFEEELFKKKTFKYLEITDANFFGTPYLLNSFKLSIAQRKTFFIDIDGTLIYTTDPITYDSSLIKIIPGTLDMLTIYKEQNHIIVLTTARKDECKMIKLLADLKIPYDKLITNISSGQRILINDKKPYFPLLCTAVAYQPERDKGILGISGIPCPTLIKKMFAFSAADVYLVEVNGVEFIRKYISKSNLIHFENLKRQVDDIKRFNFYWPGSCPKILNVFENNDEFYYDMEYLSSHVLLSSLNKDEQLIVVDSIFSRLIKDVYCYKKKINGHEWVTNYINEKINPRLNEIEGYDEVFYTLINSSSLLINNKSIMGLRSLLERIDIFTYTPSEIQPIHGDLTLQNILYCKSTNDIKLIDLCGTKYMDSYYLDIGKVFQSLIARYEEWNQFELFQILNKDSFSLNTFNLEINSKSIGSIMHNFKDDSNIFKKGVFYMITHLIRAIPYFYKKDKQKAFYTTLLSCWYLSLVDSI